MREELKDNARLNHIVEAIDNIIEFTHNSSKEEFLKNKILKFAVIKNLEIIGEASYFLTKQFREMNAHIEWQKIITMRHILVHDYYQVKEEIIWDTIQTDIKPLREQLLKLL